MSSLFSEDENIERNDEDDDVSMRSVCPKISNVVLRKAPFEDVNPKAGFPVILEPG